MKKNTSRKPYRWQLPLIVFLCGAVVLIIELLGTRVIAPHYGNSLYVWASLMTITMVGLSLGYFFGGRLSDHLNGRGLRIILFVAALSILLIPILQEPVLSLTDPLGIRMGALLSACVLFLPSLTALGMVSPFALKLASQTTDHVGSTAGRLYAISTLGSVIGTLLLGFFLFPVLGIKALFGLASLALIFSAVILG